ncbi:MAG: glycosyltransferase family 2 protein [Hyphomicrobiaceae bacterium]
MGGEARQTSQSSPPEPSDVASVRDLAARTELPEIGPRTDGTPPQPAVPILVSVVRNEIARLPDFLRHHRRLGITHFAFIDNGSDDGSLEFLFLQPDVRIFEAAGKFDWRRKQAWITHLIGRLGRRHWYLLLDADEHCVFDGSHQSSIESLVTHLQSTGRTRARAGLVDMYCASPILASIRPEDVALQDFYDLFDAATYTEHRNARLTSRTGGPRARLFGQFVPSFRPQLTKYPLFKLMPGDIAYNPHVIWPPADETDDPCLIGLLHYKFDADVFSALRDAVTRKQYWNESAEYRVCLDALRHDPELSFFWHGSRSYRSPQDLVDCGIIDSIPQRRQVPLSTEALADAIGKAAHTARADALHRLRARLPTAAPAARSPVT